MESPSRNTSYLTTVQYLAVYVKDPPSILAVPDPDTLWASTDPASFLGRLRSGSLFLSWTSSFMINSNWAARWATCHHHRLWATRACRIQAMSLIYP